jgi:HD domain
MNLPSRQEAIRLLEEAEKLNPGPWVAHSKNVAAAARIISDHHSRLDAEAAYIMGLLHDIGRREGITHIRHLIDGYTFLNSLGYDDAARISITHSFPIPDLDAYFGERDCSSRDLKFIDDFIHSTTLNDYDSLIQLCDSVSLPSGFCLLEKRIIDVAMRYGINDKSVSSWQARFLIKERFESEIGCSIYLILPGIIEGTFGCAMKDE